METDAEPTVSPLEEGKIISVVPKNRLGAGRSVFADGAFRSILMMCTLAVLAIVGLILFELISTSHLTLKQFGFKFLTSTAWSAVDNEYGALPFIYGTIVSSLIALVLAVPLSLGTALFLTEICPAGFRGVLSLAVELLAAIPSVIYGLWGIFTLAPFLKKYVQPFLAHYFGWTGLFGGMRVGWGMLAAGMILAVMILPIIASITREVINAVPRQQREAALALGATKWEMLRIAVLRNARVGILGAVILGLGRAFGETMAVAMVIGNTATMSRSLFAPAYTLASVVANEFAEAPEPLHTSALMELALVLFALTMVVNAVARLLVWSITRGTPAGTLA